MGQLRKTGREADAEEAEHEGPGTELLDRRDHVGVQYPVKPARAGDKLSEHDRLLRCGAGRQDFQILVGKLALDRGCPFRRINLDAIGILRGYLVLREIRLVVLALVLPLQVRLARDKSAGTMVETKLMMREAARNPRTNLGKRSQMIPAPTVAFFSPSLVSQYMTDTTDRMRAQIPIQMSRPMTFIRVNVWIGASPKRVASSAATAKPAASANSDVPTMAPATPGRLFPERPAS